jgi:serine/threonine protein kinase
MELVEGVSLDWIIRRLRETNDVVYVDEIRRARHEGGDPPGSRGDPLSGATVCGLHRDSWAEFADIGHQVALALGHAHEAGVLHNDIKPANLLLERTGKVIVTDFGIGRRADGDRADAEEQPTGTLRYMAPERLAGHSETRSDIYALGLTLYELVTRTPAFDIVDRRELADAILRGAVRRPRELVPHIPRGLEKIILNAMAPVPDDRYASAAAMAVDLLKFINGRSIHSTRAGFIGRVMRWASRPKP